MTRDKSQPAFFRFSSASLFTLSILLTGCSLDNDALDDAASRGNSFPPGENSLNDFSESSTGDSSQSAQLEANQIRVTLEVPEAVGPDGEKTRRNLRIVEPESLAVYQTDESLRPLDFPSVRIQSEGNKRSIITFNDGLPLGPDVIVEASYGGERLRSLAADSDRDVKINPFSEYLAAETLGAYSPQQFQQILDCVDDAGGSLCLNKYVWGTLADQVHDFEIDIPATLDVQQAVAFLDERADFASYVASMADYALLGQESSGRISASSADYNTVLWIAELGQTFRESSLVNAGQWGVRSAAEETVSDTNGTGYFYPGLTLTSFDVFNILVTSLASDIPYNRETLIHSASNEFFERNFWELNTHSSAPGAATIENDNRLLAGRALFQSITGEGSSEIIGWTRNPYYLDAFLPTTQENDTLPDRVVSGYFTAGKAIELVSENRQLKREATLENHYLSVLELNLLRSDNFDAGILDSRDYNVVYLTAQMNGCSAQGCPSEVMVVESGVGDWAVSAGTVTQTMASSAVSRNNTGAVTTRAPADNPGLRDASWLISERRSRVFSAGEGQALKSLGRLNLDRDSVSGPDAEPQIGMGATTPEGTFMAFNIDTASLGKGILIASEQADSARPDSGRFRLQGVGMAMAADSNRLSHFDNALLTINSLSTASLSPNQLNVVHDVSAETVSEPSGETSGPVSLSYSGDSSGAASFTTTGLTLTGFYTRDRDQFYLQVRQSTANDELLGLVLATRVPD
ncbi:hypothetical protein [Marinobacter confluentis]|uniref:Uncharacterized protein n=1 Tax=Marinobacter confluentis TaxID=1697557 RepID=A0A4Z1C9E1_9GAMM|nr:hypothetical protein [Marinobacter confluentis]TGN39986.1 hypothetical protein E5Q11_06735 [Marinobacter confluentis]